MSDSTAIRINGGGYSSPFSGVGMEFFPLGITPGLSGVVIHETGHLRRNAHWNFTGMYSPYWRLIHDWKRGHKLLFPGREIPLGPDLLVLIPDHVRCDFRGEASVPTTWMHFTYERRPAPEQPVPMLLSPTGLERGLLEELADCFGSGERAARQRVSSLSQALLQVVLTRAGLRWLAETPDEINRVTRYVREHYAEPLYNRILARECGLSERSLARAFKEHQGVSPARFVAQVRVREAAQLLAASRLGIDEIAVLTGHPSGAYLSRVFKKMTGQSPTVFRRSHQKGSLRM